MKDHFMFSKVDTVELARKYGTPLYVMSEDIIEEKLKTIKEHFLDKYPDTKVFYASKAFISLRMCQIINSHGIGLDAVSGGEAYTGLKAGMKAEDISLHGNNKTDAEIELALEKGIGKIILDSISEIYQIENIAKKLKKTIDVLIRVNPSTDSDTHEKISTAQTDCKFGVPLIQVVEAAKLIQSSQFLTYKGLHYHIGSQIFKNHFHIAALKKSIVLVKSIKDDLGLVTEVLNIGGGLGVDYMDFHGTVDFKDFISPIMDVMEEEFKSFGMKRPEVHIEPGRWIAAEAGITLYTVGVIKEIPQVRTYVSVDGGMPDNPRPALYDAKYNALVANKANAPKDTEVTIAGKCCETGDVLIKNISLPKLERGDILAVLATGAYNYSMASNYNGIPKAAVVFVKDGKDVLSVRKQTYDDLLLQEMDWRNQ